MLVLPLPCAPLGPAAPPPARPWPPEVAALGPALRGLIARVLGQSAGHPDVEDATQEALRRVLENTGNLRPGEPLRPWAFGVARHVALDALRARRQGLLRHGSEPGEALGAVADDQPDPEAQALAGQQAAAVRAALAQLPPGTRQALVLFHGEGLSYQQIADRLSLPVGTVATWVSRGRKAIADACAKPGERHGQ